MRYEEKRRLGVCHLCGGNISDGRAYCESCSSSRAARARAYRHDRQGKCKHCGVGFIGFKRQQYCERCAKPESVCRKLYLKGWRQQLKRETFAAYGGSVCACCGESEIIFLTIDHIDNNGAAHRRAINPKHSKHTAGVRFYGWLKRNKFPSGYQVLCMNCQWGKKHNGGTCPHVQGERLQSPVHIGQKPSA